MSSATSTPTLESDLFNPAPQVGPLEVSDLFNLGVQVGPVHELPAGIAFSGDCTNDGCTASCASCGCSANC
ncbi:hypothetical protein [Nonomuraea sp. NPDC049784]|uniref:hypothetical protein n=1 Tax=Nonomuraea sp. NPDC049784 TaxID=3154361 RepID=UPI0033C57A0B